MAYSVPRDSSKIDQIRLKHDYPRPISHNLAVPPILDHFARSASTLLGISCAEFYRRLLTEAMLQFIAKGVYAIPPEHVPNIPVYRKTTPGRPRRAANSGTFLPGRVPNSQ